MYIVLGAAAVVVATLPAIYVAVKNKSECEY